MSKDTLAELLILVEAVGIEEATKSIKKGNKAMRDAAKKSKNDTKALQQFSSKFGGAMAIIAASMATAVGSLLTQVPIVGEIFDALKFIVESLAFMFDEVLRPVLQPLADSLFNLGDKFNDLSPAIKTILTIAILAVGAIAGITAGVVALAVAVIAGSAAALGFLAAVAFLSTTLLVIGPYILLIIGLFKLWEKDFLGVKTITMNVIKAIQGAFRDFIAWIDSNFGDQFRELMSEVKVMFADLGKTIKFWMGVIKIVIGGALAIIKKIWDSDFLFIRTTVITGMKLMKAVILPILAIIGKSFMTATSIIIDVIQFLLAILRGDWKTAWNEAKSVVSRVANGLLDIFSTIGEGFKGIVNVMIDGINSVIEGLNSISFSIPDWVPVVGGKEWSMSIPKIPSLKSQGVISNSGIAEVHAGEAIFTMDTLTNAMINAFRSVGLDNGFSANIFIDGRELNTSMDDSANQQMNGRGT